MVTSSARPRPRFALSPRQAGAASRSPPALALGERAQVGTRVRLLDDSSVGGAAGATAAGGAARRREGIVVQDDGVELAINFDDGSSRWCAAECVAVVVDTAAAGAASPAAEPGAEAVAASGGSSAKRPRLVTPWAIPEQRDIAPRIDWSTLLARTQPSSCAADTCRRWRTDSDGFRLWCAQVLSPRVKAAAAGEAPAPKRVRLRIGTPRSPALRGLVSRGSIKEQYELEQEIGSGGYATVWHVR